MYEIEQTRPWASLGDSLSSSTAIALTMSGAVICVFFHSDTLRPLISQLDHDCRFNICIPLYLRYTEPHSAPIISYIVLSTLSRGLLSMV